MMLVGWVWFDWPFIGLPQAAGTLFMMLADRMRLRLMGRGGSA